MKQVKLCAMFLTIAALMAAGCGGEPNAADESQGIQITKQTETDLRVTTASEDAKASIFIHRNGLRDVDAILDPDIDSPYDSDILVRNRRGFPFVTSGNHGLPNDPDTGKTILSERPSFIDKHEQIEDLQLAIETVERLRAQSVVGVQYNGELRSLFYMLDSALNSANDLLNKTSRTKSPMNMTGPLAQRQLDGNTADKEDVATANQAFTAPYTHTVWIRYSPIFWIAWQGDHSAIKLEISDSLGALIAQISTRNHGMEATDPRMYSVWTCPSTFSGRNVVFPAFQPYVNSDTALSGDAGGCNTSYGFFSGQHVCNDDSIAQYWNIKYLTTSNYPTCSDSTLRKVAPHCE